MKIILLVLIVLHGTFFVTQVACSQQPNDFDVIKDIHSYLDDDHNGDIDLTESTDYVQNELHHPGDIRQLAFHNGDSHISVDDLWKKWKQNEAYKWKIENMVHWLTTVVQLPEYASAFRKNKVEGKDMLRLSTPKSNFLLSNLKIKIVTHRQKIYLRATDLILFGPNTEMKIDKNFEAIKAVHAHLDDDQNGNIDTQESVEYMREELLEDSVKRHSSLHNNDNQISVDDLWKSWQKSEVYKWTVDDVILWLKTTVGLPEYEKVFREKKVDGKSIPRLATEKFFYLNRELGITNLQHRRKICLRASDIILFGAPEVHRSYFNDTVVLVVVLLSTFACLYAFREKNRTQKLVANMSRDLESLQQAELTLKQMQESMADPGDHVQMIYDDNEREKKLVEEIETAKKEASRLHLERGKLQEDKKKLALVEQELSEVRLALVKSEMEIGHCKMRSPKELQYWLQLTYKKESQSLQSKKQRALVQMELAKDACNKVNKTRRTVFGSLRLAHGQTIDDVDQKIIDARSALAEVTNDLQERQKRWNHIEEICSFSVVTDGLFNFTSQPGNLRKKSITSIHDENLSFRSNSSYSQQVSNKRKIFADRGADVSFNSEDEGSLGKKSQTSLESKSSEVETVQACNITPTAVPVVNSTQGSFEIDNSKEIVIENSSEKQKIDLKPMGRANTEPTNLSRMGLINGVSFQDNMEHQRFKQTYRNSLEVDSDSSLARSFESIPRGTKNSDSEDIAYMSDDSLSSSVSQNVKKKRKGLKKMFTRSSKKSS